MTVVATENLTAAIEALRHQISELTARLERLEFLSGATATGAPVVTAAAPAFPRTSDASVSESEPELSREILLVISAAVAAFLGERGHIRAVRLVASGRWGQEGRVSIQASHRLNRT